MNFGFSHFGFAGSSPASSIPPEEPPPAPLPTNLDAPIAFESSQYIEVSTSTGSWNDAESFGFQWYYLTNGATEYQADGSAIEQTYAHNGAYQDCNVYCAVTAFNANGSTTVNTAPIYIGIP